LPGIPGVGEKTAAKWINQFGSFAELVERADEVKGKAYHAIVRTLRTLKDDETLLVQSGKPVGVLRTSEWAGR
ncbi:hypothetical protein CLM85_04780, partial [Streptomyces albidoflavus]